MLMKNRLFFKGFCAPSQDRPGIECAAEADLHSVLILDNFAAILYCGIVRVPDRAEKGNPVRFGSGPAAVTGDEL